MYQTVRERNSFQQAYFERKRKYLDLQKLQGFHRSSVAQLDTWTLRCPKRCLHPLELCGILVPMFVVSTSQSRTNSTIQKHVPGHVPGYTTADISCDEFSGKWTLWLSGCRGSEQCNSLPKTTSICWHWSSVWYRVGEPWAGARYLSSCPLVVVCGAFATSPVASELEPLFSCFLMPSSSIFLLLHSILSIRKSSYSLTTVPCAFSSSELVFDCSIAEDDLEASCFCLESLFSSLIPHFLLDSSPLCWLLEAFCCGRFRFPVCAPSLQISEDIQMFAGSVKVGMWSVWVNMNERTRTLASVSRTLASVSSSTLCRHRFRGRSRLLIWPHTPPPGTSVPLKNHRSCSGTTCNSCFLSNEFSGGSAIPTAARWTRYCPTPARCYKEYGLFAVSWNVFFHPHLSKKDFFHPHLSKKDGGSPISTLFFFLDLNYFFWRNRVWI